jgi:uncharacterized protein YjdB
MKRIFQTIIILSALAAVMYSCKKDQPNNVVPISKVRLNITTATIPVGGVEQLKASIYPTNATSKTVKWSSDNVLVATIDSDGLVKGVAPGITVIRVSDVSGKVRFADCVILVQEAAIPVTNVSINKPITTVSVNGTETLNYTVAPSNANNKNVTWSSNNASVATVDNKGTITGIAAGSATITMTSEDGGLTSSCVVTVTNEAIAVTGVTLNNTVFTVSVNGTGQLLATVAPTNATNKNVKWSSNIADIATVNANGLITGISAGTAIVTATSEDGGFAASCVITVQEAVIPVTGMSLNKNILTVSVNGTEQLAATVAPANATNKNVKWGSNATNIATVSAEGVITGIATGAATVTATSEEGGFAASCVITVQEAVIPVTGVSLNKTVLTVSVNGTEQLAATVAPANATNKNVTWSSNAATVATVSAEGVITGVSAGTATVTATSEDGKFTATCVITVNIPVTGVSLNKTAIDMYVGDVEQLSATVIPNDAVNTDVTWSSSSPTVVTVSDDGVVTGVSAGTATVTLTLTSDDGKFTVTCAVTVKNEMGTVTSTGWSAPSSNSYEYSMTYVAQVAFRGTLSTDVNTEVAAFVGNELRGYAKLVYEQKLKVYLVNMVIYSNSAGNETVILKAYNPTKQRVYENCKEFVFQGDTSLGLASEILNCMP